MKDEGRPSVELLARALGTGALAIVGSATLLALAACSRDQPKDPPNIKPLTAAATTATATATVAATSAGVSREDRLVQCNKLIEVINTGAATLRVTNAASGLNAMADHLDAAAKKLDGIEITIDKLKSYREQYKTFMLDFAKAARAFSELQAVETQDRQKSQDALASLNSALQKSSKLTDDINNYCRGD